MDPKANSDTASARRAAWITRTAELISGWGAGPSERVARVLGEGLEKFEAADLERLDERLRTTGGAWGHHAADPVARRISRVTHALVLEPDSALVEAGALEVARERPVFLLGNHLSYEDANALDYLLDAAGFDDVLRALSVVVGPKVYAEPIRRLASLCFGAIKIPQSTTRASGEAVMPMREVARLSARALADVRRLQEHGEHVLIFVEGSRSRSAAMQPALTALARYLEAPDVCFVPFGLWGTERLLPVGRDRVSPATVRARFGRAVDAAVLREHCSRRAVVADAVGFLIADLLPPEYRGVYAEPSPRQQRARDAATAVST